jgi:hypothetical protein
MGIFGIGSLRRPAQKIGTIFSAGRLKQLAQKMMANTKNKSSFFVLVRIIDCHRCWRFLATE